MVTPSSLCDERVSECLFWEAHSSRTACENGSPNDDRRVRRGVARRSLPYPSHRWAAPQRQAHNAAFAHQKRAHVSNVGVFILFYRRIPRRRRIYLCSLSRSKSARGSFFDTVISCVCGALFLSPRINDTHAANAHTISSPIVSQSSLRAGISSRDSFSQKHKTHVRRSRLLARLAERVVDCDSLEWAEGVAVCSQIAASPAEAVQALSSVGLNAIPCWTRPWFALSNGERARCALARCVRSGIGLDDLGAEDCVSQQTVYRLSDSPRGFVLRVRRRRVSGSRLLERVSWRAAYVDRFRVRWNCPQSPNRGYLETLFPSFRVDTCVKKGAELHSRAACSAANCVRRYCERRDFWRVVFATSRPELTKWLQPCVCVVLDGSDSVEVRTNPRCEAEERKPRCSSRRLSIYFRWRLKSGLRLVSGRGLFS